MKKTLPFLLLLWACAACWAIHTQRVPAHVMFGGATTTTTTTTTPFWEDPKTYAFLLDEPMTTNTAIWVDNSGQSCVVSNYGFTASNIGTNATRSPLPEFAAIIDGIDDYMDVIPSVGFTNSESFTIGGWVWKGANTPTAVHILCCMRDDNVANPDWQIAYVNLTTTRFIVYDDGDVAYLYTDFVLPTQKWTFVCGVYDSSLGHATNSIIAYTNGAVAARTKVESGAFDARHRTTKKFHVADLPISHLFIWDGRVDMLFFHNAALSSAEVNTLYQNVGGTSGPVGNIRARLPAEAYP